MFFCAFFFICIGFYSCEHTNESETQTIDITNNTVWKDKGNGVDYRINKTINITNGATLTVEPGVIIEFEDSKCGIWLDKGVLKMIGTVDKPIVVQGSNNQAGSWMGISVSSKVNWNDNKRMFLDYVQLLNAGIPKSIESRDKDVYGNYSEAAITIFQEGFCSIKNSTISGSLCNGIYLHNDSVEFYNNRIINNAWSPITCDLRYINKFDTVSNYKDGNGKQYIDVIEESGNFPSITLEINPLNVPYRLTGTFISTDSIIVKPGCVFEMESNSILRIGTPDKNNGCLYAVGTPDKKITFKGVSDGSGSWRGIMFLTNSDGNLFEWCKIIGAGAVYPDSSYYNGHTAAIQVGYGYNYPAKLNMYYCSVWESNGWIVWVSSGAKLYASDNIFSSYSIGEIHYE
jgi:hypothetical protein